MTLTGEAGRQARSGRLGRWSCVRADGERTGALEVRPCGQEVPLSRHGSLCRLRAPLAHRLFGPSVGIFVRVAVSARVSSG